MTTLLISQSNYIPWRGYFDLIAAADVFIILDDVQYTHQDWRNRNQIKTRNGPTWITIPVRKEHSGQRINDARAQYAHRRRQSPGNTGRAHCRRGLGLSPICGPGVQFRAAADGDSLR